MASHPVIDGFRRGISEMFLPLRQPKMFVEGEPVLGHGAAACTGAGAGAGAGALA